MIRPLTNDIPDATDTGRSEFGRCIRLESVNHGNGPPRRRPDRKLIESALSYCRREDFDGLSIHVDARDLQLVHDCRALGFQHVRTDVRYAL